MENKTRVVGKARLEMTISSFRKFLDDHDLTFKFESAFGRTTAYMYNNPELIIIRSINGGCTADEYDFWMEVHEWWVERLEALRKQEEMFNLLIKKTMESIHG
jgi:hypothetical protein